MEDPFDDRYTHYSHSQEDLFNNSLLDTSPEPSPSSTAFDVNGIIIICSAPETPASETAASPSGDEFKTPPEHSRLSSSEETPPPQHSPSSHGGRGTPAVKSDCVASDAGTHVLGLSQEENLTPKMVEVLSNGEVRVGEVDLESFRARKKRVLLVGEEEEPSIRVSVDTPKLRAIEMEVNVEMDVETEELDCAISEAEQMSDTDVIEDCNDTEEECVNNGGMLKVQQEEGMETASNTQGPSGNVDVVMEVLRWLAEEEAEKQSDNGSTDFLETVMRGGLTFPVPKWRV